MNGNIQFLGIVQNGIFQLLIPHRESVRLTGIQMQEARPPETGELNLTEYEGQAVMIRGHDSGDWIYSAEVIDQAGPILTMVVQQVFGQASKAS